VEAAAEKVATPVEKKPAKRAKAPEKSHHVGISTADIALRAYFISEKRRSQGLHGTEHHDWVEAERQLVAEQKKTKKKSAEAK
jgi:hypothetical protein